VQTPNILNRQKLIEYPDSTLYGAKKTSRPSRLPLFNPPPCQIPLSSSRRASWGRADLYPPRPTKPHSISTPYMNNSQFIATCRLLLPLDIALLHGVWTMEEGKGGPVGGKLTSSLPKTRIRHVDDGRGRVLGRALRLQGASRELRISRAHAPASLSASRTAVDPSAVFSLGLAPLFAYRCLDGWWTT